MGRAAFEVAAVGIAANLSRIEKKNDPHKYIADRVKEMWKQNEIDNFQKPGLRGTQRISQTIPFGIQWFK